MQDNQFSSEEEKRIDQDHKFYQYQHQLQQAKLYAGIQIKKYDYQIDFDVIKRIDWLKRIDKNADERLIESYEKQTLYTSNIDEFEEAKVLIFAEEKKRKKLHILRDQISMKITKITQSRKGLPLVAPNWENYVIYIDRFDIDLSFLSSYAHKDCNFERIQFDQIDYQTLSKIYNSYLSPDALISAIGQFLGLDENRIILASSNPRFSGFECWTSPKFTSYDQFKACQLLEYIDFDDSFIIKYGYQQVQDFIETEAFKSIDVWVDPLTMEIFVRSEKLPLKINRNISFGKLSNIEHIPLMAFDYSVKAWEVNIDDIAQKIQSFTPNLIIRELLIFNGESFEVIPSGQDKIWSFANSILFSYSNSTKDNNHIFIFDCVSNSLTQYEYRYSFTNEDLIKLFSDTIHFLKISAFELNNPDDLISALLISQDNH